MAFKPKDCIEVASINVSGDVAASFGEAARGALILSLKENVPVNLTFNGLVYVCEAEKAMNHIYEQHP